MQRKHVASFLFLFILFFTALAVKAEAGYESLLKGNMERFKLNASSKSAPDVNFFDEQGKLVSLSSFRGRTTLVMLWATWCPYCRTDMPHVNEIQEKFGGKDFTVLPVSVDAKGVGVIRSYYKNENFEHLAIYNDPQSQVGEAFDAGGLPYFILLNKSGQEIGRIAGQTNWATPEAKALLQAAIAAP